MLIIGLVGGVASGKSAVAAALARQGAVVFNADHFGHEVLREPAIRDELVKRWGRAVLDADGQISRAAVAARVFGNSPEAAVDRQFLEQLTHPRIRQRILDEIRRLPDQSVPAAVIDAALLFESGWNEVCQTVAFVDAPLEARRQRARLRGWSDEELSRREAAQLPIEEKRRLADYVIENSGSLADLEQQVARFWAAAIAPPVTSRSAEKSAQPPQQTP
jgi:dephospho-CoA kinase